MEDKKTTKTWNELLSKIFSNEDREHMGDEIKYVMRDLFNASVQTPKKTREQTHLKEITIIPATAKGDIGYESFEKIYNQIVISLDTLKNWDVIKDYKIYNKTEYTDIGDDIPPMPDEFVVALINFYPRKMIDLVVKKSNTPIEDLPSKRLNSIHLVTEKLNTELCPAIFMVIDEHYERPIRFKTKNEKGEKTAIAKLHDLAYIAPAPQKRVDYNKRVADDINNGLFKKSAIREYVKNNHFKKPTLVKKSEDKKYFVLGNEIIVKTQLISKIPPQFKSMYQDKIT